MSFVPAEIQCANSNPATAGRVPMRVTRLLPPSGSSRRRHRRRSLICLFWLSFFPHAGDLRHLAENAPFARKISIAPARQSAGIAQKLHSTVTDEHFRLAAEAGDFGDAASRKVSQRFATRKPQKSKTRRKREFCRSGGSFGRCHSSGGGIRTPDTRIMIPLL